MNRLLSKNDSRGRSLGFTYDKVGNRKTVTLGSLTANSNTRYYNYVSGTNRLANIRIGSATGTLESGFTFDNEGRLTAQTGVGARTLTWDAKGRIKTLTQSGTTETYSYDPTEHRVGRSGGAFGSLNYFLEGEHLESIYKGTTLEAKYLRGSSIDELVAGYLKDTDNKLKPYIFHQDNLTSTSAVSGHNGTVHQSIQYTAFGNVRTNSGTSPSRLKYTGREDDNTGLYYYRARYYDPQIGRFLSEDPKGFAAGINFYAYVGNNPINANDPMGLDAIDRALGGVRFVGGLGETVVGAVIAVGGSPTIGGTVLGGAIALHGLDQTQAGLRQMIYDSPTSSFTSQGLQQYAGFSPLAAELTDVGLSFTSGGVQIANGARSFAVHAADPLADGLSTLQILNRVDKGSVALNNVDFLALGGGSTSALAKADMLARDVDATGDVFSLTTTSYQRVVKSFDLMSTGLTPSGGFATGGASIAGAGANIFSQSSAGGGFVLYPNKANTNMMSSVYSK